MKKTLFLALIFAFCLIVLSVCFAEAPTETGSPLPSDSALPGETAASALPETATPVPTPVPTPEATMAVIATSTPDVTEAPAATEEAPETDTPKFTPSAGKNNRPDDSEKNENNGEIVFWTIVALVVGIWIGIAIGAMIWRKKSVFMTDKEKKIIGRM